MNLKIEHQAKNPYVCIPVIFYEDIDNSITHHDNYTAILPIDVMIYTKTKEQWYFDAFTNLIFCEDDDANLAIYINIDLRNIQINHERKQILFT